MKVTVQAVNFDIAEKLEGQIESQELTLKELFAGNGMVGFVAKERVDGKLVLPEAIKLLKMKAGS